jgi:hypothetical protein
MQNEYIHSEPKYYLTEGTNEEDLKNDDLFDVYCVVYKVKSRIPNGDNNDMYSFTTKFEQAFKRFKLFPHGYATIIRILTNDDKIMKLAIEGTTEPYKEDEIPAEIIEALNNLKISDLYGGLISPNAHLSKITPLEPLETPLEIPEAPPSSPSRKRSFEV